MIYGIDVSSFQGHIDWHAVKAAGKDFVFIKASEGLHYVSPTLQEQIEGTLAPGIIVAGIYHFARLGDDPAVQGRAIGNRARALGVRPILDVETQPAGMTWAETRAWCRVAFDACDQAFGTPDCMMYSYMAYLNALQLGPEWSPRPLWLAIYPKLPTPAVFPIAPKPWGDLTFWQYGGDSNHATCPGIAGYCDLNVWPLGIDELGEWIGVDPLASTDPAPP